MTDALDASGRLIEPNGPVNQPSSAVLVVTLVYRERRYDWANAYRYRIRLLPAGLGHREWPQHCGLGEIAEPAFFGNRTLRYQRRSEHWLVASAGMLASFYQVEYMSVHNVPPDSSRRSGGIARHHCIEYILMVFHGALEHRLVRH